MARHTVVDVAVEPADDRLDPALARGSDPDLRRAMETLLGAPQVHARASDLVRYASDASPYRLVPQVVVSPRTVDEVAAVLRHCAENGLNATFRAGGTSLSGQSQCDGVLVDVRRHWSGMVVEDGGRALRARPGTVLEHANAVLARQGRRLGPDPASARAACLGGVVANNAAGMRCRMERSAYATLRAATFVTASGTIIDTAAPGAEELFVREEPTLAQGLMDLREEILADPELTDFLRRKYSIRNTTGYTMRALLDGSTPLEIFRRLLVGSEGTLAFIAEVVMDTLPIPPVLGLGWVHLADASSAVDLVAQVRELGAEAVEMMMSSSLVQAASRLPGAPAEWATLPPDGVSLLVEFGGQDEAEIVAMQERVRDCAAPLSPLLPVVLSSDPAVMALGWRVRSGLASDMALNKPQGAVNVNEDVCFPTDRLAEGVRDLSALLTEHGFNPQVVGHAAYGNMHFTLATQLSTAEGRQQYSDFMKAFAALVVDKYQGSLKAEHGTGINMAPFVEREWGERVTGMMWRVKELADPHGVLGRDVMLTRDPQVHLKRFKQDPLADPVVDGCVECGFCEPVCPSRNVTTTPRQRIALRREMARQEPGSPLTKALLDDYQYEAVDTCAVDSSCAEACPYGIDTGAMMKSMRVAQASPVSQRIASLVSDKWGAASTAARFAVAAADVVQQRVGTKPLAALTGVLRRVASADVVPSVPGPMPRPARRALPATGAEQACAVYFPACVNRIFGRDPGVQGGVGLSEALVRVSARAGRPVWIPDDVDGLCCGTPFGSKGYPDARDTMYVRMARALLAWSEEGRLPVVIDASSCAQALIQELPSHLPADLAERFAAVQVMDPTRWAAELLPALEVPRRLDQVTVHTGCSARQLGQTADMLRVCEALAQKVHVPISQACCGTAGDRGLLHPELVASATEQEVADLGDSQAYVSSNRTCEMGLRQATGKPFESVVLLLEELTR